MRRFSRLASLRAAVTPSSHEQQCQTVKVGVIDVPFSKGQKKGGVEQGPKSIRAGGLLAGLAKCCGGTDVKDYGEITYENKWRDMHVANMNHYGDVVSCNKALADKVERIINDGRVCLTLGGDHSIGIGSINGHIRSKSADNVAVLWIDAHADLNTNRTSSSGNVHGMPMALLGKELQQFWPDLPGMKNDTGTFSLRNLAYIGLRSVDPYEHLFMHKMGITSFDMYDVERYGIDTVVSAALDKIDPHHNKSIHVSFDIDSLDPLEAPSTGTAVRGGLLLREGIHIATAIHKTGRLGALDLVEVNPQLGSPGDAERTVTAAIHIILAAFGHNSRGITPNLPRLYPEP